MNLSLWHESLRGEVSEDDVDFGNSRNKSYFIHPNMLHWPASCLRPQMFSHKLLKSQKNAGLRFLNLCHGALVLSGMVSCCHPLSRGCIVAQYIFRLHSVWEAPLDVAKHVMKVMVTKDYFNWGEKVWMILKMTRDKWTFETSFHLFDCYFIVAWPDNDLRTLFSQVQT